MDEKRRHCLLLAAAALAAPPALALDLLEGADYVPIPQQPLADPRRVEVVEFFYYGCRWCNELQPHLDAWLKRKPAELVGFLFRDQTFPSGAFLMTGTGIVPGTDFTLAAGDEIRIEIDGVGRLVNTVAP